MSELLNDETKKVLVEPLVENNPITLQVLGICSALAVTSQMSTSLIMALALTMVTACSSAAISSIRNHIPSSIRIIVQMTIIASLVIVVDQLLKAFAYDVSKQLSVFVGLIITNCIVMGRAEAFAVKNPVKYTLVDGFASGMGYTYVLISVSVIREVLAFGTILNYRVMPDGWVNWVVMAMAPGGFFILGLFIWLIRELTHYYESPQGAEQ